MSIVALSTDTQSRVSLDDLRSLAADLHLDISNDQDAADYLLLLQSFDAVMQTVEAADDYLAPQLRPQDVIEGDGSKRTFWKEKDPKETDPLNAWSHRCRLQAAKPTSDRLQGRTVAIKDNICVGGLPTTLGTFAEVLGSHEFPISPMDATVVARVLSAGAVIVGTSTCENFCASPLSFTSASGPVHNPRLLGHTSGGSSSGSAALIASRILQEKNKSKNNGPAYPGLRQKDVVDIALGGDQAGSIRIPSSYCGIYGLKPTFGLVPYTGAASMTAMIDHLGPMAATLEDIAALLQVLAGYDGLDARMTPESPTLDRVKDYPALLAGYRKDPKPLKVGIITESLTMAGVSPDVAKTVVEAARTKFAAAGATVVDVSVPMHKDGPVIWTASTRPSMSSWECQAKSPGYLTHAAPHLAPRLAFPSQEIYERMTELNPGVMNIIFSGQLTLKRPELAWAENKAHRKVLELRAAYDEKLQDLDILVTPCAPTVAMPHPKTAKEEKSLVARLKAAVGLTSNTCPFNVTGHPAMNVPCGTLPAEGHPDVELPVGMQIVARRFEDETLLRAAALFEGR